MKVLIAEKEFITADRIGRLVSSLGHRYEWICSPEEAAVSLREGPCDLMILSAQLGAQPMARLIPQLRQYQPDLSLVVTTSRNTLSLEQQVRAHGITYYLIKPIHMNELSSVIRHTSQQVHRLSKENHHEETNTWF